jgi:predicted porin
MLFWSLLDADVMGPNVHSMSNIDSYIPNARADNSIAYKGKFDGITVGATYSFGRDVANAGPSPAGTNCAGQGADHKACREWSALVKYDAPAWGVAAAIDELRGGPGAFGGLTNSSLTDRRTTVNGYVRLAGVKIAGGLLRRNNEGSPAMPRSDLWFAGVSYPVAPNVILDGQFIRYDTKSSPNDANFVVARATYVLSKRTAVYASASHIANKGAASFSTSGGLAGGNPPPGAGQSGIALGVRHVF